jgi:hypothetical protein
VLNDIILNVTNNPFMLSVVMASVVALLTQLILAL